MSRGMHRHRRIRLDNLQATKLATRAAKRPGKIKARSRRDARLIAKIKATASGVGLAADAQSWLSAKVGKPYSRITVDEIAAAIV